MLSKAALLIVAVSLALLLVVVTATEEQEQGVEKKAAGPTTLSDVINILMDIQKRVNILESRRTILLRGKDGRDGKDGLPGPKGKDGRDGRDGRDGKDGHRGINGLPGPKGAPGLKGEPGNQGVRGPPGPKSGGVQYVRWGRTSCPYNATLVYKGRIGGEDHLHTGGGTNYVCLPENPKYGRYRPGHQPAGYMYGSEYEFTIFSPFTKSYLHEHEAVCAVCYVKTRSAKMMIPATYECPAEWTREYHGYLMSENHSHPHPTEYICVDNDADIVPGTHANLNGALLYPVEGVCGSLPCRPYVEGRELTCAVCTK